jgi:hypothetical protein
MRKHRTRNLEIPGSVLSDRPAMTEDRFVQVGRIR